MKTMRSIDRTAIGGVTRRAHSHPPQPMDEASLTMDDPAMYPTPLPNGMAITNIDMTNERSSLSNKSVMTKFTYYQTFKKFDFPKNSISQKTRFPEKLDFPKNSTPRKTRLPEKLDFPKYSILRNSRFPEKQDQLEKLPVGAMHEYDASPIPTIARVARKKLKFSGPLMKDDPITTAVQNIKPHKIIAFLLYRSPGNIN